MALRVADMYCGAGGLSEGFRQATRPGAANGPRGYEIVYGFDRDRDAMATYRRNHFAGLPPERATEVAPQRDVAHLSGREILKAAQVDTIDVVVGGPNCQGVSAAGLRNRHDSRNSMFAEFRRLVDELDPAWFVMENVPGLTHVNNRELLREILLQLAELGYDVAAQLLLAADFGCAQLRHRLFIVGTNTGVPIRFPRPRYVRMPIGYGQPLISDLPVYRTVRDAIGDLEDIPPRVTTGEPILLNEGRTIYNHVVFDLGQENLQRIRRVGQGEDWRSMPVGLLPERNFTTRASDQKGTYGRLSWDQPAFTITGAAGNVSAGCFIHPTRDGSLSVREAARIQGFSDAYRFDGDANSGYRQVGNAVPPALAQAVAETILACYAHDELALRETVEGTYTLQLVVDVLAGKATFPVGTPRHRTRDERIRAPRVRNRKRASQAAPSVPFIEDPARRVPVEPEQLVTVRRMATLGGNLRAARRARAILRYFDGQPLDELVAQAGVSLRSVRKWVEGFYSGGAEGWRAYHTPLEYLTEDQDLLVRLRAAVARVREHVAEYDDVAQPVAEEDVRLPSTPALEDGQVEDTGVQHDVDGRAGEVAERPGDRISQPRRRHRPHMNPYLRSLIARYHERSVEALIRALEEQLGQDVGTVYVDDLLAMCDVLLVNEGNVAAADECKVPVQEDGANRASLEAAAAGQKD